MLILMWAKGFFGFAALFILTELAASFLRPDYQSWLRSHNTKSKGKVDGRVFFLFLFVFWPLPALDWLIGMYKGQTLLERLTLRTIAIKERERKKQLEAAQKMTEIQQAPHKWKILDRGANNQQAQVLVHDLGKVEVLSHVILGDETGGYLCIRAMPKPEHSIPWKTANTLGQAMKDCIGDYDWAFLCMPGMESDQRKTWLDIRHTVRTRIGKLDS